MGLFLKGTTLIKEAKTSHFQLLFKEESVEDSEEALDFLKHVPRMVNEEENVTLLKPFTDEEISNVIWKMEPDKSLGPDGFSIHFYRLCWDIIKADLHQMIKIFLRKAKVGRSTKSTFLALIPKEANPETFDRFGPILLCNTSYYKILTKLLANRIKPLLEKLISPNQGGFVKGRHILDNVILVQEIIHSSHQRKEKGMLVKLNMENAFDRVRHSFLLQVLYAFGFSSEFVKLIKPCIGEPWITTLVNGRPENYFKASRGIRQGCPLSPFLYILMTDSLSRKLTDENLNGTLPGMRVIPRTSPIYHALFANDSILLGGASIKIARALSGVIYTQDYDWVVDQQSMLKIAQALGFTEYVSWGKFKYLGLPLTFGTNKAPHWMEIISKFKAKMTAWGG